MSLAPDRVPTRLYSNLARRRVRSFLEEHRTSGLVLEVGAKAGAFADFFPNRIGGDLVLHPNLDVQLDGAALPVRTGSVPTVLCAEVLEHCPRPADVIDELHRVLRPGGSLLLTTRFVYPVHDAPHDYFRFTRFGLELLLGAFSAVTVTPTDNAVESSAILLERIVRQSDSPARLPLLAAARLLRAAGRSQLRQFGDVDRTVEVDQVACSGYAVHAVK